MQDGLSLEPHGSPAPLTGIPAPAAVPAGFSFFEEMRTWTQAFPPSAPDQAYQKRFAPLGLLDPVSPYADCPPDLARALTAGADAANQQMESTLAFDQDPPVGAFWSITMYDLPDFYLVANPIGCYSIGDRTLACVAAPTDRSPS